MGNSKEVPTKIRNKATIWYTIPLLGTYSNEMKSECQIDMCTPMTTAALFTTAKKYQQSKCPSLDEWINKIQSHNKSEILLFRTTCVKLEIIMLSKIRHKYTSTAWYYSYVESKEVDFIAVESRMAVTKGCR
jgi:hypothetical protein